MAGLERGGLLFAYLFAVFDVWFCCVCPASCRVEYAFGGLGYVRLDEFGLC